MAIVYRLRFASEEELMASAAANHPNADSVVLTDETMPRSVYNPATGAYDIVIMERAGKIVEYAGCVLCDREENGYDDSDFYAVVWSEAKQKLIRVDYASTRYGGGGYASVDATPEVIEKARAWIAEWVVAAARRQAEREAEHVKIGRVVKVVKGRKVPIGVTGVVKYICDGQWGERLLLDTKDGEAWVSMSNVAVAAPVVEFDESIARQNAARVDFHVPFARSGFLIL